MRRYPRQKKVRVSLMISSDNSIRGINDPKNGNEQGTEEGKELVTGNVLMVEPVSDADPVEQQADQMEAFIISFSEKFPEGITQENAEAVNEFLAEAYKKRMIGGAYGLSPLDEQKYLAEQGEITQETDAGFCSIQPPIVVQAFVVVIEAKEGQSIGMSGTNAVGETMTRLPDGRFAMIAQRFEPMPGTIKHYPIALDKAIAYFTANGQNGADVVNGMQRVMLNAEGEFVNFEQNPETPVLGSAADADSKPGIDLKLLKDVLLGQF